MNNILRTLAMTAFFVAGMMVLFTREVPNIGSHNSDGPTPMLYAITSTLRITLSSLSPSTLAHREIASDKCPRCNGTGKITCPDCGGRGYFPTTVHGQPAAHGCTRCGGVRGDPVKGPPGSPGSGKISCPDCRGTGRLPSSTKIPTSRPPAVETDAAQRRAIEEQQAKEAEKARSDSITFIRARDEALKLMKGIPESKHGLKGVDTRESGLKGVTTPKNAVPPKLSDCDWGTMDASVVDLRCLSLDPNKPITIDPNVVRGRERAIPAQIDTTVFENIYYKMGFGALMEFEVGDAEAAVEYFKKAQEERPNDPLVRNGLLLAQDILKARRKKIEDNKARAAELTRLTYASLMTDELGSARAFIVRAQELDPSNTAICFLNSALALIGPRVSPRVLRRKKLPTKLPGIVSFR